MTEESIEQEDCPRCPHAEEPHVFIPTTGHPLDGGVVFCPVKGCRCYATWGVNGREPTFVPEAEELEKLRVEIQGEGEDGASR